MLLVMRAVALLVLVALRTGVARADVTDLLRHEELRLPNGLRVLLLPDDRVRTVAVVTWFRVGSGDEVRGKTGLAHLFEHLMFKGSPHIADGVMDKLAEEAGGWTNAATYTDMTVYTDVAASAALERLLWLEGDRIAGVDEALDQAKLDNQREVVLNERRQRYENAPYGMAEILLGEALWPEGHPFHAPGIGYPEDLRSVTVDDARGFFRRHYAPGNALMVIAGDLDVAAARRWVPRYLGGIAAAPRADAPPRKIVAPLEGRQRLDARDDVQVPRVYLRWRAPAAYAPDQAALELAAAILAGGKSSRLYQRLVVEERLAQEVFAGHDGQVRAGEFSVIATAKPGVEPGRLAAALDREVAALAKAPPTAGELERAKNTREADFLESLADPTARAEKLAEYAVVAGNADYLRADLARFRAVTAADVQTVVGRWLSAGSAVALTISPRSSRAR
jgi:predicted Zn-dependent peptidase